MKRSLLLCVLLAITPIPAYGDDLTIGSNETAFVASDTDSDHTSADTEGARNASTLPPGHEVPFSCFTSILRACGGKKVCDDGTFKTVTFLVTESNHYMYLHDDCPTDQKKQPTVQDIENAFKKIPMPASALHIQPPHGETLVNFDTIFFTDPFTLDKQVTVLDATVDFHITVAHYTWHYGDGTSTTTQDPGAAYPHQTVTHRYLHKGTVNVSLDTTYQADYRINGGPQQHLDATVTIPSPTQSLTIRTATPHLVGS